MDHIVEIVLFLAGLAFAALGIVNPSTAPIWVALTVASLVFAVAVWQRARLGSWLVGMGIRVGGAAQSPVAVPVEEPLAPPYVPPSRQEVATARAVMTLLRDSFDAARYDNEHGDMSRRAAAEHAALTAVADIEASDNRDVRMAVRAYRDKLFLAPPGWKYNGGANSDDMGELKQAYDHAVDSLGAVLRG